MKPYLHSRRSERGTTMIEYALVLPTFLIIVFGMMSLIWTLYQRSYIQYAIQHTSFDVPADYAMRNDAKDAGDNRKTPYTTGDTNEPSEEIILGSYDDNPKYASPNGLTNDEARRFRVATDDKTHELAKVAFNEGGKADDSAAAGNEPTVVVDTSRHPYSGRNKDLATLMERQISASGPVDMDGLIVTRAYIVDIASNAKRTDHAGSIDKSLNYEITHRGAKILSDDKHTVKLNDGTDCKYNLANKSDTGITSRNIAVTHVQLKGHVYYISHPIINFMHILPNLVIDLDINQDIVTNLRTEIG